MNSFVLIMISLFSLVLLVFIIELFKKKRCVLCDKKSSGLYYRFKDFELISTKLIDEKKLYVFKKEENLKENSRTEVCYDCSLEVKKNLVDDVKSSVPKKVNRYFDNEKNLLFLQIKKTEVKPLLIIIFLVFAYLGLFIHRDINSLYFLIGIEGLIIYPLVWIVYNNVYWHAYVGEKGIILYQNYILFNIFYQTYPWRLVKSYSVDKNEVKFNFNKINLLVTLFNMTFFMPLTIKKKQRIQSLLNKNKIPLKN